MAVSCCSESYLIYSSCTCLGFGIGFLEFIFSIWNFRETMQPSYMNLKWCQLSYRKLCQFYADMLESVELCIELLKPAGHDPHFASLVKLMHMYVHVCVYFLMLILRRMSIHSVQDININHYDDLSQSCVWEIEEGRRPISFFCICLYICHLVFLLKEWTLFHSKFSFRIH